MKKILGYGLFYLIGLICVISMMFRVDSLENGVSKQDIKKENNIYAFN